MASDVLLDGGGIKRNKFMKTKIEKIGLTVYILLGTGYLFFIQERGLVDFILLLFPILIYFLTRKWSLKNRIILLLASLLVLTLSSLDLVDGGLSDVRFWCYGEGPSFLMEADKFNLDFNFYETVYYKEYCRLGQQIVYTLLTLLFTIIPIGILTGIIMLIWKDKKSKKK